ncbi:MAG: HAD hydrolase-like protein [Kiritimatiellae bacterium]|nr:HAD hydrolase-like protein [Kiritimatiellia bacterium]
MTTRFDAALFDLDGTLLDTLRDLGESMNRALATFGRPPHAIEDYRCLVGDGILVLATRALPEEHRSPEAIEALLLEYRRDYQELSGMCTPNPTRNRKCSALCRPQD